MKFKKVCAAALVAAMLASPVSAWAAVSYPDVDVTTEQGQAIVTLTEAGVLGGYEDGTFRPNGSLTRAEFVKIVNGTFGYSGNWDQEGAFDDETGHWAQLQIAIARQKGYIGGVGYIEGVGNHCFAPNATITREQVAAILCRILKLENVFQMKLMLQDPVSDWAREDVETALACGIFRLEENNTFRATEPITRAEVCLALAPYTNKMTSVLQKEQRQLQKALLEAEKGLSTLHYTDQMRSDVILYLQKCVALTLQDSKLGVEVNKEYVEKNYAEEVKQTKTLYGKLDAEKRKELKTDIINCMSLDALSVLNDYFLSDESSK